MTECPRCRHLIRYHLPSASYSDCLVCLNWTMAVDELPHGCDYMSHGGDDL